MSCVVIAAHGIAELYLLGQLDETDRAAFEQHYFECNRCFDELKTLEAIRAVLPGTGSPTHAARHAWWPVWLATAAAVFLVAAMAWLSRPSDTGQRQAEIAAKPVEVPPPIPTPTPQPPAVAAPAIALTDLARFDPPRYVPPVLRGPEDDARRTFQAAMPHYMRGDYRQAVNGLRKAASLDPSAVDVSFFLGVTLLLAGETDAGVAELQRTVALGASPYLEEAYFYLAKGLLQRKDVTAARQALRSMMALGGDHQREAKQLQNQIERATSGQR
jgi:TolA-binding protein